MAMSTAPSARRRKSSSIRRSSRTTTQNIAEPPLDVTHSCQLQRPPMQTAHRVRPTSNLTLRQRRLPRRAWRVDANDAAILALSDRGASPNLLAGYQLVQAHDLTAPALTVMTGGLSALVEILMNHLVQWRAAIGHQIS